MIEKQLHKHDALIVKCSFAAASGNYHEAEEIAQRARILLFSNYERIKNADGEIDEPMVRTYVRYARGHYAKNEQKRREKYDLFDALEASSNDSVIQKSASVGSTDALELSDTVELTLYTHQLLETLQTQCKAPSLKVLKVLVTDPEQSNSDVGSVINRSKDAVRKQKLAIAKIARAFDASHGGYFTGQCAI